jgi:hydrogenase maturation protease
VRGKKVGRVPMSHHALPLVIGTGNELLRDDAVGLHVLRLLGADAPPGVQLTEAGTDVVRAMPLIERAPRLLLVCALRQGRSAGSLSILDGYDLPRNIRSPVGQELTVPDLIEVLTPHARPRIFSILSIEPAETYRGIGLSPVVEGALPHAEEVVRRIVHTWVEAETWLSDAEAAV